MKMKISDKVHETIVGIFEYITEPTVFLFAVFLIIAFIVGKANADKKQECLSKTCPEGMSPTYISDGGDCICAYLPK